MHWIEGSGKVPSAVATLNEVAERRRRRSAEKRKTFGSEAFEASCGETLHDTTRLQILKKLYLTIHVFHIVTAVYHIFS